MANNFHYHLHIRVDAPTSAQIFVVAKAKARRQKPKQGLAVNCFWAKAELTCSKSAELHTEVNVQHRCICTFYEQSLP